MNGKTCNLMISIYFQAFLLILCLFINLSRIPHWKAHLMRIIEQKTIFWLEDTGLFWTQIREHEAQLTNIRCKESFCQGARARRFGFWTLVDFDLLLLRDNFDTRTKWKFIFKKNNNMIGYNLSNMLLYSVHLMLMNNFHKNRNNES